MASAEAVARYLLWLATHEPGEEPITHLRLQKLLYYAQGWAIGSRGEALFAASLEAWRHGPVVREVYSRFAEHDRDPIPASEARDDDSLSGPDKRLLQWVWLSYGKFSASELWRMTHREPPWVRAREGVPPDSGRKLPIDPQVVREFFTEQQRDRCRRAGIDPDRWSAAMEDVRAGRTAPLDEVIAELQRDLAH
ncbi:MAG: type II toxin-antitoxin system antitoxin SocA domain-containing protein [Phycisphaerales bacterium]